MVVVFKLCAKFQLEWCLSRLQEKSLQIFVNFGVEFGRILLRISVVNLGRFKGGTLGVAEVIKMRMWSKYLFCTQKYISRRRICCWIDRCMF